MFSIAPGVMASTHLLAAFNSQDGSLEYRFENIPPREAFIQHKVLNGRIEIGDVPGLGITLDSAKMDKYRAAVPS